LDQGFTFHSLRHTFATALFKRGGDTNNGRKREPDSSLPRITLTIRSLASSRPRYKSLPAQYRTVPSENLDCYTKRMQLDVCKDHRDHTCDVRFGWRGTATTTRTRSDRWFAIWIRGSLWWQRKGPHECPVPHDCATSPEHRGDAEEAVRGRFVMG
jgi:hypothetical protein